LLTIGVSGESSLLEQISEDIKKQFSSVNLKGRILKGQRFLDLFSDEDEIKAYVAKVLSDIVITHLEGDIVERLLVSGYDYFTEDERRVIRSYAENYLRNEYGRKEKIYTNVISYLEENSVINLDGFITFRLQEYLNEIGDRVDDAVDDFLLEREHGEFLRLLRYFVEVQDPKTELIHVVVKDRDSFQLLDEKKNVIEHQYLAKEPDLEEYEYDDLLISALITLVPSRIMVHSSEYLEIGTIETLVQVFGYRLELCSSCSLCKSEGYGRKT